MNNQKPTYIPLHVWACVDKKFKYHGIDDCGGYFYIDRPTLNINGRFWINNTNSEVASDKCLAGIVPGSHTQLVERPISGGKHATSTTVSE